MFSVSYKALQVTILNADFTDLGPSNNILTAETHR